ncbi:MAG: hypothetical protein WAN14_18720 [Candidatus Acidiferrales bacterium]
MIFFEISVATPVRLFFQQKEIVAAKEVGGAESAYSATNDHHIVAFRYRRLGEGPAIAHLMADFKMFAVHLCLCVRFCAK